MSRHKRWPTEVLVSLLVVSVLIAGAMIGVALYPPEPGATKATTTTTTKATTTTTTLQPIPTTDIEELTACRVEYRRATAAIESIKKELEPIMAKKRSRWTTKELTIHYTLDFDLEQAEKQRDAAVAKYKALANKYGAARLAAYGLEKGLE